MQGDDDNREAGFLQSHVAAFGLAGNEARAFKRADGPAARNPREARQMRTST